MESHSPRGNVMNITKDKVTIWFNLKGVVNSDLSQLYKILGRRAFHQYVKACMRFACDGRIGVIPVFSNFFSSEKQDVPARVMISFTDENILNKLNNIPSEYLEVYIKNTVRACMGNATIYSLLAKEEVNIIDLKALTRKIRAKKRKPLTPAQRIKKGLTQTEEPIKTVVSVKPVSVSKPAPTLEVKPQLQSVTPISTEEIKPVEVDITKAEEITPITEYNPVADKINQNFDITNDAENTEDDDLFNLLEGLID